MPQIFTPAANYLLRATIIALIVLPVIFFALAAAWVRSPYTTGTNITVSQPVPFSHLHHVGDAGIDCRFCHQGVESSPVAGMPSTHVCMTCHSQLWTDARVLEPVRRSAEEGTPIRWNRVHSLPEFVYFDHAVHVNNGVGCTSCHGQVDHMPLMRKAEPMTMEWCLNCHRDPASQLRPEDMIFSTDWTPPRDQAKREAALMQAYRVNATQLTDCTVCHR